MHECRDPAHMGTPQASRHGGPVRACVHRPGARMHGDPACERAWGPGASMRAGPGACVHGNRAGVGARCEHACMARCERACMARCVRACVGTPRASGHGDPVHACIKTKRVWGPGASVRDGPCERAGKGTRCERARWALRASRRGDLVRASVRGPGACVLGPSACVNPAGTDTGVQGSGKDGVVVNPRASKHSACKKITKFTYL